MDRTPMLQLYLLINKSLKNIIKLLIKDSLFNQHYIKNYPSFYNKKQF